MQLIHHPRAHLHQPMPMPQQLPQIPILCVRHPDPRKAVFHHQPQQQLRILAIGLLLAHSFGANLRRVPDPQLKLQARVSKRSNQRACPLASIPTRTLSSLLELAVELLGFFAVSQPPFAALTCFRVHKCNLLEARMIVTTYNQHVRLLSSEPFGWFAPPKSTRAWEPTLLWNHYTQSAGGLCSGCHARQAIRHLQNVGLPHLRSLRPSVSGRMMDRDADRLMVAYLYLEFAAMFVDESYFASEAPLCRMDADGRNHARLAADDVRRNFRTITLDLQRLRMRVALMVVDAHIPAAEVVEGQSGAVEPLAESVARPADERTALAVLLRARALTQNVEVGGNRPVGVYDWAAEQCGFHGSMVSRRSACVDQSDYAHAGQNALSLITTVTITRMEQSSVSLHDLLARVPLVLTELSAEFYRVGGRSMDIDPNFNKRVFLARIPFDIVALGNEISSGACHSR